MDINDLTIGQAKELAAMFGSNSTMTQPSLMIGHICVVRTNSAGVHIGAVESHNGTQVVLTNARRLWKWAGAFTLSEVATHGIDPHNSRISCNIKRILLTEAIELIPASDEAIASFMACHEK
jgi:hypothetical protein